MRGSPTGWIALTLVCLTVVAWSGFAAAQVKPPAPDYEEPPQRASDPSECYEQMVKMLYAATDPSDPLQESYLLAAQAYRELDDAMQGCHQ